MTRLFRRLTYFFRQRRMDAELAEEIEFHRAQLAAAGKAARAMGNVTLAREDARGVWIAPWLESVWQDAHYAARTLRREPVHTVTAVAVLVLAIGLNVSLYTTLKAVALDPWPARDPDRVVRLRIAAAGRPVGPTYADYQFIRAQARSFSAVAAHTGGLKGPLIAPGRGEAQVALEFVSSNFFDMLGARLHLGTPFIADDDTPAGRQVAVLGYHLWRTHFGADPAVVGQTIRINGKPVTVVGVLEERIDGLYREEDVWLPLSTLALTDSVGGPGLTGAATTACCLGVAARLAPGVDAARARLELQMLHERFASGNKQKAGVVDVFGTELVSMPGSDDLAFFGMLFAGVGLVLLLACANVGNLQLARGLARRREISTRLAIGASRGRVVRQLVVEGLVLAGLAGAASIAVAAVLPGLVLQMLGEEIPPGIAGRFLPDARVVAVTALICLSACLLFGLAPAVHATRRTIPLGTMDRGSTRRGRFSLRGTLLGVQIAACTVLLVGAGLVTRAIAHALVFDPGFKVHGLSKVTAYIPEDNSTARRDFARRLLAELERDPQPPIALAEFGPVSDAPLRMNVAVSPERARESRPVMRRGASRRYFDVLGLPLVSGRMYASDSTGEAVVNQSFERAFWPGEGALGRAIHEVNNRGQVARSYTIVGVVRDAWLTGYERIEPVLFRPTLSGSFFTHGGPAAIERIRGTALALNDTAVVRARPIEDDLHDYLEESRLGAAVAWGIGLLGLLLAAVGVFGVFAYAVEERRREIGVRLALGAAAWQVVRTLVSSSGRALLVGLAAGLLGSLACGPVLGAYLFGLNPLDPLAYGGVIALLTTTAMLATLVPARRAARIDPAITLRED